MHLLVSKRFHLLTWCRSRITQRPKKAKSNCSNTVFNDHSNNKQYKHTQCLVYTFSPTHTHTHTHTHVAGVSPNNHSSQRNKRQLFTARNLLNLHALCSVCTCDSVSQWTVHKRLEKLEEAKVCLRKRNNKKILHAEIQFNIMNHVQVFQHRLNVDYWALISKSLAHAIIVRL